MSVAPLPMEGCSDLSMDRIRPSTLNPRAEIEPEALAELMESIRNVGLIQPIVVRPGRISQGGPLWEIIAGHRRYEACRQLGHRRIAAVIRRQVSDAAALELMLCENLQRADLDPIEVATAYRRLIDECKITQTALAERVGKTKAEISTMLGLLELPPDVQHLLKRREITVSHGKYLLSIADQPEQVRRLARRAAQGLRVADIRREVGKLHGRTPRLAPADALRAFVELLDGREEALQPEEWAELLAQAKAALGMEIAQEVRAAA